MKKKMFLFSNLNCLHAFKSFSKCSQVKKISRCTTKSLWYHHPNIISTFLLKQQIIHYTKKKTVFFKYKVFWEGKMMHLLQSSICRIPSYTIDTNEGRDKINLHHIL